MQTESSKSYIQMKVQLVGSKRLVIIIDNYPSSKPQIIANKFMSTKSPSTQRIGIGTESIRSIVKSNNGEVRFDWKEQIFSVSVILTV